MKAIRAGKIVSLLLCGVLSLAILEQAVYEEERITDIAIDRVGQPQEGSGTASDPYAIGTLEELLWFSREVNGGSSSLCGVLIADIDLGNQDWIPIGKELAPFSGIFDGNGYAIYGLNINDNDNRLGLFGVTVDGRIKNLIVRGNVTGNESVGGLIGSMSGGTVERCSFHGTISGRNMTGGIVGKLNGGSVQACYNTADIKTQTNNKTSIVSVGGIVGYAGTASIITDCYNTGQVTGTGRYSSNLDIDVGGIAGLICEQTELSNCYNIGTVTNNDVAISPSMFQIGGIVGDAPDSTVTNCYYLLTSVLTARGVGSRDDVSGSTNAVSLPGSLNAERLNGNREVGTVWQRNAIVNRPMLTENMEIHTVTVEADSPKAGVVTMTSDTDPKYGYEQIYPTASFITITAVAKEGYSFKEWQVDGLPISTEEQVTLIVSDNRTYIGVFEEISE